MVGTCVKFPPFAALLPFMQLFGGLGKVLCLAAALIFISPGFSGAWGAEVCHHDLKIEVQPEAHRLLVSGRYPGRRVEGRGDQFSVLR